MSLNEAQKKGLREQLIKERNLLERAKNNVALIETRISGLEAALKENR